MGSKHLTVTCREQFGIFHVTRCQTIIVDSLVLLTTALHNVGVLAIHLAEGLEDGLAIASPVAFVVLVEVTYVLHLIVAYEHITGILFGGAEVVGICQSCHITG